MIQGLKKTTSVTVSSFHHRKNWLICGVKELREMGVILRHKLMTHKKEQVNVKIAESQFVLNFISYVSAKYYLNWFTAGKVTAKINRVNFLLRHSVFHSLLVADCKANYRSVIFPVTTKLPRSFTFLSLHCNSWLRFACSCASRARRDLKAASEQVVTRKRNRAVLWHEVYDFLYTSKFDVA